MRFVLTLALALVAQAAQAAPLAPGDAAPFATLPIARADGTQIDPASLANKVILLDIWATWCEPCRASLPLYQKLQTELGPSGFTVVAISIDEHREDLTAFLAKSDLTFPIGWDPQSTWPAAIGLTAMPTALLIGRTGKVQAVYPGFVEAEGEAMAQAIRALVKAP